MIEYTAFDIALLPVIVAVVGLVRSLGLPAKVAPIVALALGIGAAFVYVAPGQPAEAVLVGITLGLAASGLYSGGKNAVEGVKGLTKKGE
mgnify:CR=1 FL=1